MKIENIALWGKIEAWLVSQPSKYTEFIGDKEQYTIKELNQKSNEYLSTFYDERCKVRALINNTPELSIIAQYKCKQSFLFWILLDSFSKDVNRNPKKKVQPVIPYPHQLILIETLQFSPKDIHLRKSRRQGASLIILLYAVWCLLFENDFHIFATHKDLASLDVKGDETNCTFGKIRFTLNKSLFFDPKYLTVDETKRLIYKSNSIDGAVLTPNTTVGFQANLILVDEIDPVCESYPNKSQTIFGAFSTSCNRMIIYSTYRGIQYPFYQLFEQYDDKAWDFLCLDWKDHPLCNISWYDNACARMGQNPVLIARELDHNPTKAIKNQILSNLSANNFIKYNPETYKNWKKLIMADVGGGTSATVFITAYYSTDFKGLFLHRCLKTTSMTEVQVKKWIDSVGFGNVPVAGDRSGNSNATTPQSSWKYLLQTVGITYIPVDNRDMEITHNLINLALLNDEIFMNTDEPHFQDFYTAVRDAHGVLKNDSSHTIDALGYGYKYLHPVRSGKIEFI